MVVADVFEDPTAVVTTTQCKLRKECLVLDVKICHTYMHGDDTLHTTPWYPV